MRTPTRPNRGRTSAILIAVAMSAVSPVEPVSAAPVAALSGLLERGELQPDERVVCILSGADDPAFDSDPVWSPDGRHITFSSNRDGDYDIYVMDADGSNIVQLTDDSAVDFSPAWQP